MFAFFQRGKWSFSLYFTYCDVVRPMMPIEGMVDREIRIIIFLFCYFSCVHENVGSEFDRSRRRMYIWYTKILSRLGSLLGTIFV